MAGAVPLQPGGKISTPTGVLRGGVYTLFSMMIALPPKLDYMPTLAFVGPARAITTVSLFVHFYTTGGLFAAFLTLFSFTVHQARLISRAALVVERQYIDTVLVKSSLNLQPVSHPHQTRGFYPLIM